MAVSLNGSWKLPLGYFLIRSFSGSERANLLTTLFQLLDEVNVKSYSITFDGAPTNLNMFTSLRANFNYFSESFQPFFVNPITEENCFVFFDLCHMIKLVRNTFADKKILSIKHDVIQLIQWENIVKLVKRQTREGLRPATKLTQKHIDYRNNTGLFTRGVFLNFFLRQPIIHIATIS
jgi:hypothetical protein